MPEPSAPDAGTREHVLALLADFIARAGGERFLRPPVAPGAATFPDPWAPTPAGVQVLLRRLMWHADLAACGVREVRVDDRRAGKPVTERMPATRIEAAEVRGGVATFVLGYVGADDVVGTAAHEVGAVFAALHRPQRADPYRSAEPPAIEVEPADAERGSIATVYLGLGVLAANGAFQEYSRAGKFNGAYEALEHDVLKAGALPMSVLAYAVAVQAVARASVAGADPEVPSGLRRPQADEVRAWIAVLRERGAELVERLGLAQVQVHGHAPPHGQASPATHASATGAAGTPAVLVREPALAFADVDAASVARDDRAEARRIAFRWRTNRGGVGVIAGAVVGVGFALLAGRGVAPWLVFGGASGGHVIGRRVRVPRCSGCAHVVRGDAVVCPRCGATLRGDIDRLADRLDAEERLDAEDRLGAEIRLDAENRRGAEARATDRTADGDADHDAHREADGGSAANP